MGVVHRQLGPDEDLSGRRGRTGRVCDDHDGRAMARGTARTIADAIRGNWQRGGTTGDDGQESDAHEGVIDRETGAVNSDWEQGSEGRRGTTVKLNGMAVRSASSAAKGNKEQGCLFSSILAEPLDSHFQDLPPVTARVIHDLFLHLVSNTWPPPMNPTRPLSTHPQILSWAAITSNSGRSRGLATVPLSTAA